VGQAIDYMRDTPDLPERFYEIYAVDAAKHWQGAVPLDVLLRSRRPVPLAELIDEDFVQTVFPHPTLSEMMHESVLAAFGRVLHI